MAKQFLGGSGEIPGALATALAGVTATTGTGAVVLAVNPTITGLKQGALAVNAQTGTTYTFALADSYENGTAVNTFANANPVTVTFPKNSVVAFPIGHKIETAAAGAGKVTFAPVDGDVTLVGTELSISANGKAVTWVKTAINTWKPYGSLIA
jgi:hypothetical protein